MKLKTHQPYASLQTIIALTRPLAKDQRNVRAVEFIRWVDSLGHTPTDAEFEAWCRGKGVRMVGEKGKRHE